MDEAGEVDGTAIRKACLLGNDAMLIWRENDTPELLDRVARHRGGSEPVEPLAGLAPSVLLRMSGPEVDTFVAARIGTSPFRPLHRRRNWFVGVTRAPSSKDVPELREADSVIRRCAPPGRAGRMSTPLTARCAPCMSSRGSPRCRRISARNSPTRRSRG